MIPDLAVAAALALLFRPVGQPLEGQDAHLFLPGNRQNARPEIPCEPVSEIDRKEKRIKGKLLHRRQRCALGMGGKTQPAHLALLPGFDKSFHRPAGTKGSRDILIRGQSMELIEIKVIGLEDLKRMLQLFAGLSGRAHHGLAGEKAAAAIRSQCGPQSLFGVTVAGRHIKIIDAVIKSPRHHLIGHILLLVHHQNAAETQDREFFTGAAETAFGHALRSTAQKMGQESHGSCSFHRG